MTVTKLKAAIRERDGHRCRRCGMTADESLARFGKTLAVHRETPQAAYSMEDCLTLCRACHYERHRELKAAGVRFVITPHHMTLRKPQPKRISVSLHLTVDDFAMLDEIAKHYGLRSRTATIGLAIRQTVNRLPARRRKPKEDRA